MQTQEQPFETDYAGYEMPGLECRRLKSGIAYAKLHYYADPGKDAVWLENVRRSMPPKQFLREILMDESTYGGDPVWPEFVYDLHAPEYYRHHAFPLIKGAILIGSWDLGNTLSPAFLLRQVVNGKKIACLEVTSPVPVAFRAFCQNVKQELSKYFRSDGGSPAQLLDIKHWGDPAGSARNNEGYTAFEIASEMGFRIRPTATNSPDARIDAIALELADFEEEDGRSVPNFLIAEHGCPVLSEALRGAYCYKKNAGAGRTTYSMPVKNSFSHISDALGYNGLVAARESRKMGSPVSYTG